MLKDTLCSAPILKYPDTTKPYMLCTDASKYGWAGVLTQSHTSVVDGKTITMDHPVSWQSIKLVCTHKRGIHNIYVH